MRMSIPLWIRDFVDLLFWEKTNHKIKFCSLKFKLPVSLKEKKSCYLMICSEQSRIYSVLRWIISRPRCRWLGLSFKLAKSGVDKPSYLRFLYTPPYYNRYPSVPLLRSNKWPSDFSHNFLTFPCHLKTNAKALTAMRTRELGPSLRVTLLGYPGGGKKEIWKQMLR